MGEQKTEQVVKKSPPENNSFHFKPSDVLTVEICLKTGIIQTQFTFQSLASNLAPKPQLTAKFAHNHKALFFYVIYHP